jgi:hypothetical protein
LTVEAENFAVISKDDHGELARCSYCSRGVPHVVVLPLMGCPELKYRIVALDGAELGVRLCAYCVLAMAQALSRAEGRP